MAGVVPAFSKFKFSPILTTISLLFYLLILVIWWEIWVITFTNLEKSAYLTMQYSQLELSLQTQNVYMFVNSFFETLSHVQDFTIRANFFLGVTLQSMVIPWGSCFRNFQFCAQEKVPNMVPGTKFTIFFALLCELGIPYH